MSGKRIIDGAKEAVAVAKGERPAARIHVNGHAYVPEALEFRPPIPEPVWAAMVERGARAMVDRSVSNIPEGHRLGAVNWPHFLANSEACLRAALGLDRAAADAVHEPEEKS